jgi:hypothetical protein
VSNFDTSATRRALLPVLVELPPPARSAVWADLRHTSESDRAQYHCADPLASYISDPSIIFRIHPHGLNRGLPVFAAFERGRIGGSRAARCGGFRGRSSS